MALFRKKSLLDQAGDWTSSTVDSLRPQVQHAVSVARDAVDDAVGAAKPVLADARDKAGPALADARDKAVPAVAAAAAATKAKAAPVLADARDKATPYLDEARSRAAGQAENARGAAQAKVAKLKGEPEPKKGGTLKKIVLFALVAGAVGFVAKKLQSKPTTDAWQSSYTPSPTPPAPAAPTSPVSGVATGSAPLGGADLDGAAASPDEALADSTGGAHAATTPESPAEIVDMPTTDDDTRP